MIDCQFILCTALRPGAISIIQLIGDTEPVLTALTGKAEWTVGRMRLASFGEIDEGLAGRIAEGVAQVMPHGGVRVVQRLMERLMEIGATPAEESILDPQELYPEAADRTEALMLATLARAQSPLAIDLLLDQPLRWRGRTDESLTDEDRSRSARLNRLIDPPSVVLAGPPNVGKSTLSNALLGRSMSIALDQPGTTRDYTTGRIELAGLVVNWHDTPGLRQPGDEIEAKAIELAMRLMDDADLLIAITDHEHDWPELAREPDLRIANKCDLARRKDVDVSISAMTGEGIESLVTSVREALVPAIDLEHPGPWVFDERIPAT